MGFWSSHVLIFSHALVFLKIKYAGADTSMMSPAQSFCRQISREQFEQQRVSGSQGAIVELLENIIQDKNMSIKDKKKKLKQVWEERLDLSLVMFKEVI